jgi:hypothetical protein
MKTSICRPINFLIIRAGLQACRMIYQLPNKRKSLQISFVYLILTSIDPLVSNPNRTALNHAAGDTARLPHVFEKLISVPKAVTIAAYKPDGFF